MKKVIMAKIISLSLLVVLLTVLLVGNLVKPGFLGILNFGFINSYTFNDDGYSVGNAELDDDISSIYVDWIEGSVKLSVSNGKTLNIYEEESQSIEDDCKLRYKIKNGNTLDIRFVKNNTTLNSLVYKNLVIEIPKDLADKMEKIYVSTASAEIYASDLVVKEFEADTASGDVSGSNLSVNTLSVDGASSNVSFTNTQSQQIECSLASGDLKYDGKADKISFSSASGALFADISNTPKKINAETASGDVILGFPKDIKGFSALFDTASGEFTCDFEGKFSGDDFIYGDENVFEIDVDTASGDLKINKK